MVSTAGTAIGVACVSMPFISNPGMFWLGILTIADLSGVLLPKIMTNPADNAAATARCPRGTY